MPFYPPSSAAPFRGLATTRRPAPPTEHSPRRGWEERGSLCSTPSTLHCSFFPPSSRPRHFDNGNCARGRSRSRPRTRTRLSKSARADSSSVLSASIENLWPRARSTFYAPWFDRSEKSRESQFCPVLSVFHSFAARQLLTADVFKIYFTVIGMLKVFLYLNSVCDLRITYKSRVCAPIFELHERLIDPISKSLLFRCNGYTEILNVGFRIRYCFA